MWSCGECCWFVADALDHGGPARGACSWALHHPAPWWARDTPNVLASLRTICPVFAREAEPREPESSSAATRVQGADAERRADPGVTPRETGTLPLSQAVGGAATRRGGAAQVKADRPTPQIPHDTALRGRVGAAAEGERVSPQAPDCLELERDGPEWDPEDAWVPCCVCRRALVNAGAGHDTCAGCLATRI